MIYLAYLRYPSISLLITSSPPIDEWHALVHEQITDVTAVRWARKASRSSVAKRETDLIFIVNTIIGMGERFAPRPSICRAVFTAATADKPQLSLPPDAHLELADSTFRLLVAVPWRLQSRRAPSDSNEDGLIRSCEEVLCVDPCRRFSYGITVNDDNLRIWFFSRSHEFVSSPFNSLKDIPTLSRVVLSLAFATPEQLGYDTTMSHVADNLGNAQLRLTVGPTVYVTTQLLSDHEKNITCERATRVWQAYREDDPERIPVAVKDVWVSADAVQEGDQLLELHEKLRTLSHISLPHPPEHYFLTVIEHGFVPTLDGVDDDTLTMTRSVLPEGGSEKRRKHYRIVFKEVGIPIHNLQSVADVMSSLADATRALQLLYELGLVHRDVSAGNILFVDGVGKLADLEFMRLYRGPIPSSPVDRYIGTSNFIAGEVATSKYSYISGDYIPDDAPGYWEAPPFRYNPFHDLESTLLIGFWVLLYHRRTIPQLKKFFNVHFPRHFTPATLESRVVAISYGFFGLEKSDPFYPVLQPLHKTRVHLHKAYAPFESDIHRKYHFLEDEAAPSGEGSPFYGIHDKFIQEYEEAARLAEGLLLPLPRSDASKRKAPPERTFRKQAASAIEDRRPPSPLRPAKRSKSIPTASSLKQGHDSIVCTTRQSARLAEKKRVPASKSRAVR
ncbi:hypothetical protein R3P38DRAFT_2767972 [Favolaschia claudopus]|uniref:Protein kinase domain-containing protein n=1 Tax=Favolaschia claudopus TaxID=2862362 RepID=A0AAW0CWK3_9AGAR